VAKTAGGFLNIDEFLDFIKKESAKEYMGGTEDLSTNAKIRILVVDDHPIVRRGLAQLINSESDLVVCAQAENSEEAMEALEGGLVDFAIVDISLVGSDGLELTRRIKLHYPALPVLILTMHDESFYARRALGVGAAGYILKRDASEQIVHAIRSVLAGDKYISSAIADKLSAHDCY
jgi:DNA-binding NarL/FixJ family response regulator